MGAIQSDWLMLLARLCLAAVFFVSGVHKAVRYDKAIAEFRDAGIPAIGVLLPLTIALHLAGSLAVASGMFAREAALSLAIFTVVATLKVHTFWRMEGIERLERSRIALAHLAVAGGLLMVVAAGPGALVL